MASPAASKGLTERLFSRLSPQWGENTRRLGRGLVAIGPFFVLARALTAFAQILAGRWLGPREFGLATLVSAAGAVLVIPLTLSFAPAVVKFAAMEADDRGRTTVVSTAFWLQLAWLALCGSALYLLRGPLTAVLKLDGMLYAWSFVYAVLLALFAFVSAALQGVLRFKERGRVEFLYGAATLAVLLAGVRWASRTYGVFVVAMDAALIASSLACVFVLRDFLKPVISRKEARDVASYTLPVVVSAACGAILQGASPLILAAYLTPREVGYYGAYTMGTLTVASVLFQVLSAVLAPLASHPERHAGAWRKFFLLAAPFAIATFAILSCSGILLLKLIGKGYPIDLAWLGMFAAMGVAFLLSACAGTLFVLRGAKSAGISSVGSVVSGVCCLAGSFWAIRAFGFPGSAVGLTIGYGSAFLWNAYFGWRGLRTKSA